MRGTGSFARLRFAAHSSAFKCARYNAAIECKEAKESFTVLTQVQWSRQDTGNTLRTM